MMMTEAELERWREWARHEDRLKRELDDRSSRIMLQRVEEVGRETGLRAIREEQIPAARAVTLIEIIQLLERILKRQVTPPEKLAMFEVKRLQEKFAQLEQQALSR